LLEIRPDSLTEEEIKNELDIGKVFMHGVNKKGYPCIVNIAALHNPVETSAETTMKLKYFWMLKIIEIQKELRVSKFCVILDMEGLTMDNFDRKVFWKKHEYHDLRCVFNDIIDAIYIVNSGWVFKSIWYIVCKFIPDFLVKKVIINK
jgi:hypothetical protein